MRLTEQVVEWLRTPLRLFGYHPSIRKIAAALRRALACEASRLPAEQIDWVSEFIEHGEWELALAQLRDALGDLDLEPNSDAAEAMAEAAELMGVD